MATHRPPPLLDLESRPDGTRVLRSGRPFAPPTALVIDTLVEQGRALGDRAFLAERGADGRWVRLSYAAAATASASIATWLIRGGVQPGERVAILSENGIAHALMTFGAMRAGATVVPISPAYSLADDLGHLRHVVGIARPTVVFASSGERFARAIGEIGAGIVVTGDGVGGTPFDALLGVTTAEGVYARRAAIDPDAPAKLFFTSGSTGRPKGVANSHANLAAGMAMYGSVVESYDDNAPRVILDWLPWSHVYGGNVQVHEILRGGGTLYIDDGRPIPGRFDRTIENLRDVSPTMYGSVPAAFAMLADALERDDDLRRRFFANLRGLRYGGGSLPQEVCDRFARLAEKTIGRRVSFMSGWGMTETSGTGISCYWDVERTGVLGLPLPGCEVKLVPLDGDRYELRIRGPHVFRGYVGAPAAADVFDDEGFFRTGDAARWVDAADPLAGIAFAGRLAEQYKLLSGTWLAAGELRLALLDALAPFAAEVVVAGPDRPFVTALVWPSAGLVRERGLDPVRDELRALLDAYNRHAGGSSRRIRRVLLADEPLSFAAGEVTDKRSVNQRRVLERRAAAIEALYASPPAAGLLVLE